MINREELVLIGQFRKPHGIKGEIFFSFTNDSFDTSDCRFLICEIDGIFVPFIIENCRFISDASAYIKLKRIDSDLKVRMLSNKDVFFPKKYFRNTIENDSYTWDSFIGYTIKDKNTGIIGRIVDVDSTTINNLFIIENGKKEILIPAVEDFIVKIDENREEIVVELPDGLV